MKEKIILNWDQYFMTLAKVSALRSKDPNTQVGTCIVNDKKRVVGLGYNGMPLGNDVDFPWSREGENESETKYSYVIHAEINTILNSTTPLFNTTLYTTLFPCSSCAKTIVQSGIKKVIYLNNFYEKTIDIQISKNILSISGVEIIKIDDIQEITI